MERNTRLELEGGEICCESIISIGYLVENGCGMKKTVRKHSKKNPSTKPNKRYLEHREALAAQFKTGKIGMKRMRTKKIMATVGTKLEVVPTVRMEKQGKSEKPPKRGRKKDSRKVEAKLHPNRYYCQTLLLLRL